LSSLIVLTAIVLKIRKSKFQIHDGVFWFLLSILFLVLSIFPQIAVRASELLGIESAANLVFLGVLALVIIKNFLLSVKVSLLEYNLMKLSQRVAVEEVSNDVTKSLAIEKPIDETPFEGTEN
jgi:hypothetical protein